MFLCGLQPKVSVGTMSEIFCAESGMRGWRRRVSEFGSQEMVEVSVWVPAHVTVTKCDCSICEI